MLSIYLNHLVVLNWLNFRGNADIALFGNKMKFNHTCTVSVNEQVV